MQRYFFQVMVMDVDNKCDKVLFANDFFYNSESAFVSSFRSLNAEMKQNKQTNFANVIAIKRR